jgi:hypothetical protein
MLSEAGAGGSRIFGGGTIMVTHGSEATARRWAL